MLTGPYLGASQGGVGRLQGEALDDGGAGMRWPATAEGRRSLRVVFAAEMDGRYFRKGWLRGGDDADWRTCRDLAGENNMRVCFCGDVAGGVRGIYYLY